MAYDNNHEFTDWLYNRYVEANRKEDVTNAIIYLDTLNKYLYTALQERKFSKQRRHAKELLKMIYSALKNNTSYRLLLTGDEGQKEFEKTMAEYEESLRANNCPEDLITDLVSDKRMNYGS